MSGGTTSNNRHGLALFPESLGLCLVTAHRQIQLLVFSYVSALGHSRAGTSPGRSSANVPDGSRTDPTPRPLGIAGKPE